MVGPMKLIIGQAMMIQAMQEYLDRRITDVLKPGPRVVSVCADSTSEYANFIVNLMGSEVK